MLTSKAWFVSIFINDYPRARTLMAPSQYIDSRTVAGGDSTPEQRRAMGEYMWKQYVESNEHDPFLLEDIRDGYCQYLSTVKT